MKKMLVLIALLSSSLLTAAELKSFEGSYTLTKGSHNCYQVFDLSLANHSIVLFAGDTDSLFNVDANTLNAGKQIVHNAAFAGNFELSFSSEKNELHYQEKGGLSVMEDGLNFIPYYLNIKLREKEAGEVELKINSLNSLRSLGFKNMTCTYTKNQ